MSQKSVTAKLASERIVKDIRRATRKQYSAEEKIRIVLDGLRGEHSIAELCRREGIAESLYYVSEASVYRLLKDHDLIASPAYIVMKAAEKFKDKTTAPNQLWQTDFTYLKSDGAGSTSARYWTTSRATLSPGNSARR